jgi:hypothetical protein
MCQAFLPLLKERKGSRIVNLSSIGSQLKPYSTEIQERFRNVTDLNEVEQLAQEYLVSLLDSALSCLRSVVTGILSRRFLYLPPPIVSGRREQGQRVWLG